MFKKLAVLGAVAAIAAVFALHSEPAQATTGWYFVSVCESMSPVDCPTGPAPIWFGPFDTEAQCDAAWSAWSTGIFGTWPRTLSSCFQQ